MLVGEAEAFLSGRSQAVRKTMQSAMEHAAGKLDFEAAARYREGDVIGLLPGREGKDANAWVDVVVPTGLGYARNVLVVSMADAVVAVAGGAGTLTEIAMAWQLDKPIVALTVGGWSARLAGERIDERARAAIVAADTPEAAVAAVQRALS